MRISVFVSIFIKTEIKTRSLIQEMSYKLSQLKITNIEFYVIVFRFLIEISNNVVLQKDPTTVIQDHFSK